MDPCLICNQHNPHGMRCVHQDRDWQRGEVRKLQAQLAAQRKEERERHRSLRDVLQTVASYNIHQGGTGHLNITTVLMEIDRHAPPAEESE